MTLKSTLILALVLGSFSHALAGEKRHLEMQAQELFAAKGHHLDGIQVVTGGNASNEVNTPQSGFVIHKTNHRTLEFYFYDASLFGQSGYLAAHRPMLNGKEPLVLSELSIDKLGVLSSPGNLSFVAAVLLPADASGLFANRPKTQMGIALKLAEALPFGAGIKVATLLERSSYAENLKALLLELGQNPTLFIGQANSESQNLVIICNDPAVQSLIANALAQILSQHGAPAPTGL